MAQAISPEWLVAIAGLLFTVSYLIIHQVYLRLVMLLGSLTYIAYYATAADEPLWGAIYSSIAMIVANLIGLATLVARNAAFSVPAQFRDLYAAFSPPLLPGDFRALMRIARRRHLTEEEAITLEGQPLDRLFFIIGGEVRAEKRGLSFPLPAGIFAGEVAYLTTGIAQATTRLSAGAEVLEWDIATLKDRCARNPRLKLAMDAVISRDLAAKVAGAVAPGATTHRARRAEVAQA